MPRPFAGLPENFHTAPYLRHDRRNSRPIVAFPASCGELSPDLVHIPLNRVPLFMIRPYVVTIHDLANLFFEEEAPTLRMQFRRFRFRRGLVRAAA